MSTFLTIVIITVLMLVILTVVGVATQNYEEAETHCKSLGMELYAWVPDGQGLTCRGLENEQVTLIKFQRVNEKYYIVKEVN